VVGPLEGSTGEVDSAGGGADSAVAGAVSPEQAAATKAMAKEAKTRRIRGSTAGTRILFRQSAWWVCAATSRPTSRALLK
jgi:hypothetical protein